jgi:hypothetical protein
LTAEALVRQVVGEQEQLVLAVLYALVVSA